jgi:hypothetical protein
MTVIKKLSEGLVNSFIWLLVQNFGDIIIAIGVFLK